MILDSRGWPAGAPALRWGGWAAGLSLLLGAPGCGDDPVQPGGEAPDPVREVWIGSYAGQATFGTETGFLLLDVVRTGVAVEARLIFRRPGETANQVQLAGTGDDQGFSLGPDPELDYRFTFGVEASRDEVPGLSGELTFGPRDLSASFQCTPVEVGGLAERATIGVTGPVTGLAYDGESIWMGTSGQDYQRWSLDGEFLSQVVVLYEDSLHWTSGPLTSDGNHLWGHLPGTIIGNGEARNVSRILEFTKEGEITREFMIEHRTGGLAWDDGDLWSLSGSDRLIRVDLDGAVQETVELGLTTLYGLEYRDGRFWTLGWYEEMLYEIDVQGRVVRVYDLPGTAGTYPSGLVFAGGDLWYARVQITNPVIRSDVFRLEVGAPESPAARPAMR
jgi:hypothetical protein